MNEHADWVGLAGLDARYGRVLAEAVDRDCAVVLIDTNGDRREVQLSVFERATSKRWREFMSWDDVDLAGDTGEDGPVVWAYGSGEVGSSVSVSEDGRTYDVAVNAAGLWLFARQSTDRSEFPTSDG